MTEQPATPPKPISILIVEDEPVSQKAISGLLIRNNLTPAIASSAEEAETLLAANGYDLVLMDIKLPGQSGVELTKKIRERERGSSKHTLIVALTALPADENRAACIEDGMDGFMTKPVDKNKLLGLISRIRR
jgi:CheY-like chemotaxis protein